MVTFYFGFITIIMFVHHNDYELWNIEKYFIQYINWHMFLIYYNIN